MRSDCIRLALGLNSGTSADGVDVALVRTDGNDLVLLDHHAAPYQDDVRTGLLSVRDANLHELARWHRRLGDLFAEAAKQALRRFGVHPGALDVVGSHGQTVFHRHRDGEEALTLQLGEPAVLAAALDVPVVHDFRQADVAVGGCGAPLVPLLDWLLLGDERRVRLAQNLGGIGNLTVITPRLDDVVAMDTGPANAPLDLVARRLPGSPSFDQGGAGAARGTVDGDLLARLLDDERLSRAPPRSFDRDEFGRDLVARVDDLRPALGAEDLLATLTEFVAATVERAVRLHAGPLSAVDTIWVSGGGLHNRHLMARIRARLPELDVEDTARAGLDPDAKEAALFALLAVRHRLGLPGNVPGVTGASRPVVLGKLQPPLTPGPSRMRDGSRAE